MIDRMKIWKETKKISKKYYSDIPKSVKILNEIDVSIKPKYDLTEIYVVNYDCIDTAICFLKNGLNPLVLNMSNDKGPGGGVDLGCGAQEEMIFRRSNYHLTLLKKYYPLKNLESVYSEKVTIFRKSEKDKYEFYCHNNDNNDDKYEVYNMSIIAFPGIKYPDVDSECEKFILEDDKILMKNKIRQLFKIAYKYGHDSLVLSAWGCGVWGGPSNEIAELFKEVIKDYDKCFRVIFFSILDDKNNYKIFKNILS